MQQPAPAPVHCSPWPVPASVGNVHRAFFLALPACMPHVILRKRLVFLQQLCFDYLAFAVVRVSDGAREDAYEVL